MFAEYCDNMHKAAAEKLPAEIEEAKAEAEQLWLMENKTYDNFIKPLEERGARLNELFFPISHLNSVNNDEESQRIYAEALPLLTDYSTWFTQHSGIMQGVKEVAIHEDLSPSRKKVIDDMLTEFRLGGVDLPEEKKKRVKDIKLRLSELGNSFFQNLLNATGEFEMKVTDPENVEGMPESELMSAKCDDGWVFTLQMPSYLAYMTYGPNRKMREKLYRAYTTRAPENGDIIEEILTLRHELAQLIGLNDYREFSLATKTAEKPADVVEFLRYLLSRSEEQAFNEAGDMVKFSGLEDFSAWDAMYWSEKYKKHLYSFDEEEYRPYFEKNNVVEGLFTFLEKLFGLGFTKPDVPVWHENVLVYDLVRSGKPFARLYIDLESRKEKRDGAWMNNWQTHHTYNGETVPATAVVVANFPPAKGDSPSLLRHRDVVTLFHEMGHALQHLCSEVDEASVSGVNGVEWDAVEFPSQFLELFAYEEEVLRIFARHYKTGETITPEMIEKLKAVRDYHSAMQMVRQIEFGLFDMAIHEKPHSQGDIQEVLDKIREHTAPIKPPAYNKFQHGFAHIFAGGYAAGYYSYKWAERLSADAFLQFRKAGIMDPKLAEGYYEHILKKGGSDNAMKLFKEFTGREPSSDALLEVNGIR
ncbi:M3 family metallopeptidase [Limisalsivibrio acetivorans]|uniref:M3 family metallopeptidase n=1 Tax=Limisalsivibrio acetivorans TaxID=1304888 RepID=UPI0003B7385E|nr:M3 family metallopeptidase [Limisalsivibrio acetivorans]